MSDENCGGCERYGNVDNANIDEIMEDVLSCSTKTSTKYAV